MKTTLLSVLAAGALTLSLPSNEAAGLLLYSNNFNAGPGGSFSGGAGPGTTAGWDYALNTLGSWGGYFGGLSTPPFDGSLFLSWAGTVSQPMSGGPVIGLYESHLSISVDIWHNANPDQPVRFGLFNDTAQNWANVANYGWTGYGPMISYDGLAGGSNPDNFKVTFWRPIAAGGGTVTSAVIPGSPQGARVQMLIDTTTGMANGYYINTVANTTNLVISGFDMKGSWTLGQFQANIVNYSHIGSDFGSFSGYLDDVVVAMVIPEPSAAVLILTGALSVWCRRRRNH